MTHHDPHLGSTDLLTALRRFRLEDGCGTEPHGPGLFSYCVQRRERLLSLRLPHPVIGVVMSGRKEVWQGLGQQVLRAGTVFALPGGVDLDLVHELDPVSHRYQSLSLEITPQLLPSHMALPPLSSGGRSVGGVALTLRPELVRAIAHAADAIADGPAADGVRRARLAELLALIADQPAARVLFDLPVEDRLCRLIRAAPDRDWTAGRAARQLGLSESTLRRRLRAAGTGFAETLRRQRMHCAHDLIRAGASSGVAAVAVGYASRAHFARAYRAVFGSNPARG